MLPLTKVVEQHVDDDLYHIVSVCKFSVDVFVWEDAHAVAYGTVKRGFSCGNEARSTRAVSIASAIRLFQ